VPNLRIVIIGGGVIGTACAHWLQNAGHSGTILDHGTHGAACSHRKCGYICPSHVLPLTEPGAIGTALRSLFKSDSPFRVKPRFDFALMSWLVQFARRCNFDSMVRAAEGIQALLVSSMEKYEQLIETPGIHCEWEKKGLLYVYRNKKRLDAFASTNVLLRDRFNEPARYLSSDDVAVMEPALKPDMAGGWYYEHDAHLRSDYLMKSWADLLKSRGVTILEETQITGIVASDGQARAIRSDNTEIEADHFVFATGAWAPLLQKELGCKLPVQPGKGYSITMPRPEICPQYPLLFPETKVGVTPWASAYRLGSTMEFAGYDSSINLKRVELLRSGSRDYLKEPYCEPVLETWYGWRPMTYDNLPIIDRSPRFGNVTIATGHNMLGLSMATGTAALITEMIEGRPPHIDPTPYRVDRF